MMAGSGARLGSFTVVGPLGAGGMGEVWRAEDTRLGRQVALKVLPEGFELDAERHARFEREAKVLASLNHPNIATLYGLEHVDGKHVLVMELVEGEGLGDLIARGPIAVADAVPIALQIAEALEAAHEVGVVHRDLKPANVRIRRDGTVKVLDFGLAKTWESETTSGGESISPTLTHHQTMAGVILGTAAYMAPEQARGRPVDRRADVWSFGVVLWEMLTGCELFPGETLPDVMAAVLTREPDWRAVEAAAGAEIAQVVRGCLVRDPRRRFSSAGDVALLLEQALERSGADGAEVRSTASSRWWVAGIAGSALLVGLAGGVGVVWKAGAGARRAEVSRVSVVDPELVVPSGVDVSADGRRLAFVVDRDAGNVVVVRSLDQFEPVVVSGTEGAMCPFLSPDGRWLGYFTRTELRRVALAGGPPRTIATFGSNVRFDPWNAASNPTADWGPDNTIVLSSGFWRQPATLPGLFTVPASGGELQPVTSLDGSELGHMRPTFTPDGRHIVFTALGSGPRNSRIEVLDRTSGERRRLVDDANAGRVVRSGHLVYLDRFFSRLVATAIDPATLAPTGPAVPLIEGVNANAAQSFAVSESGALVYVGADPGGGDSRLVRVGLDGSVSTLVGRSASWYQPRVSPDGRTLVVREVGDECRLWMFDLERRTLTPLTSSGDNHQPVWSRGGRAVVYGRETAKDGVRGVFRLAIDGSGEPEELVAGDTLVDGGFSAVPYPDSLSPGDRELLFEQSTLETGSDLWVLPIGGGAAQPFLVTPAFEGDGAFSPDGRWVAYVSDESGRQEVYVRTYPARGGRMQISAAGGEWPIWAPTGDRLYFSQGRRLMAVNFSGDGPEPVVDRPRVVLEGFDFGRGLVDVMADGSGFVLVQPAAGGMTELRVVSGWEHELAELVPSAGGR